MTVTEWADSALPGVIWIIQIVTFLVILGFCFEVFSTIRNNRIAQALSTQEALSEARRSRADRHRCAMRSWDLEFDRLVTACKSAT